MAGQMAGQGIRLLPIDCSSPPHERSFPDTSASKDPKAQQSHREQWPWLSVLTGYFNGIIHAISGIKWDYAFYKWCLVSTYNILELVFRSMTAGEETKQPVSDGPTEVIDSFEGF